MQHKLEIPRDETDESGKIWEEVEVRTSNLWLAANILSQDNCFSTEIGTIWSRVRGSTTNDNGFWIGWLDVLAPSLQLQQLTINTCLRLAPFLNWTTSVFSSTVTDLVLIYESVTSSASVVRWLTLHSWTLNSTTEFWALLRMSSSERSHVSPFIISGEPNISHND
jgi:hypothetical protein